MRSQEVLAIQDREVPGVGLKVGGRQPFGLFSYIADPPQM
jgi:hypothetical protein